MAELQVPTIVTGPDKIEVGLVRADYLEVSATFRSFFEVFLAVTSALLGVNLTLEHPSGRDWAFFWIAASAAILFSVLSYRYSKKAKCRS